MDLSRGGLHRCRVRVRVAPRGASGASSVSRRRPLTVAAPALKNRRTERWMPLSPRPAVLLVCALAPRGIRVSASRPWRFYFDSSITMPVTEWFGPSTALPTPWNRARLSRFDGLCGLISPFTARSVSTCLLAYLEQKILYN